MKEIMKIHLKMIQGGQPTGYWAGQQIHCVNCKFSIIPKQRAQIKFTLTLK